MGMNITPLTRPEVPLTTSNLIVDSDLSMMNYNLQANNLHVGGSILRVVECIPDDTITYVFGVALNDNVIVNILPIIPSTYYIGKITSWFKSDSGVSEGDLRFVISDGTIITVNTSTVKTDYDIPDNTIGVYYKFGSSGGGTGYVGFTNPYLPLPTPPEIL